MNNKSNISNSYEIIKQRNHGHMRSASLENANSIIAKNTLGLPNVHQQQQNCFTTGTLKSNNEQKRMKNKYGSHNNLDEYAAIHNKSKFQNLKNMFEMKIDYDASGNGSSNGTGFGGGNGNTSTNLTRSTLQKQFQVQHHNQQHPKQQQQQQQLQQQQQQQQLQQQSQKLQQQQQQAQPQQQQYQHQHQKQKSIEYGENLNIVESLPPSNEAKLNSGNVYQAKNLLKPIAFKPIPFEPDYSIPNRYVEFCDRYGSTPSLAPAQGSNMKFGSTSDLRHGYSYCANLARRRCARSLKINDSMESVNHTPDSDATSQSSTLKSITKFSQDQFDTTPSPSDSGISELEAALKDRDSELSYLRQTMEHNEKDKEAFWEQETKRLKHFYENQQKEHLLKIKKLEQMLTLQTFQFKQNRMRFSDDSNRLREQYNDLKNENELLRNETDGLKTSERTVRDRVNQLEQKIDVMDKLIVNLKSQLEENEWTVCQKNGEIALLKTQLKEAKMEITSKEHELVHMKTEIQNRADKEENIYSSNIRDELKSDTEKSQLNRIIILKDQVILALTNELAKLRKELSELAITHEYGEEPAGKYSRLKYKIENLANICHHQQYHQQQQHHHHQQQQQKSPHQKQSEIKSKNDSNIDGNNIEKIITKKTKNMIDLEENELEIIINCLKTTAIPFTEQNDIENNKSQINNNYHKLNVYNTDNNSNNTKNLCNMMLPDVTKNNINQHQCKQQQQQQQEQQEQQSQQQQHEQQHNSCQNKDDIFTLSSTIMTGDSKLAALRKELYEIQKSFELERNQWFDEKEKVLKYQRQLQTHYIQMYQKMKDFESKLSKQF